jgi:hypothetical protein
MEQMLSPWPHRIPNMIWCVVQQVQIHTYTCTVWCIVQQVQIHTYTSTVWCIVQQVQIIHTHALPGVLCNKYRYIHMHYLVCCVKQMHSILMSLLQADTTNIDITRLHILCLARRSFTFLLNVLAKFLTSFTSS